jgi:hypothetical protein
MDKKLFGKALFVFCLYIFWMFFPMEIRIAGAAAPVLLQIDNPLPEENALFGRIVEGLSDIDGDGIPDIAVGARGSDRVYLLSGDDQTVIHSIEDPDGVKGFWFGFAVREIGDIDSDGVQDVAVGAPAVYGTLPIPCIPGDTDPVCEAQIGRAFVFSCATGEMILRISGLRFHLGASVAPLGDINDDSIPDFAVGAPFLLNNSSGEVYAISGEDGSILWNTVEPSGQHLASFGAYISEIEDLNGDGYGDLLVGAPFSGSSPDFLPGKAYVLSGYDGSIWRTVESPYPLNNGFFGGQPCAIGDQDDDGIEDFAIGEAGVGWLHFFSGADSALLRSIEDPVAPSTDFFGFSIAKVDDKNGDGLNELWVAASKGGRVYLMNGMGATLLQIDDPDPTGLGEEGAFGWSISATGDLDGDDNSDLIIGKSVETVEEISRAGAAFLVLGVSSNHPPIANAGADQVVSVGQDCMASVILDGSGSHDPDGDPLSYAWTLDGQTVIGVSTKIDLRPGSHIVQLVVFDGTDYSEPDLVLIDVIDDVPPEVDLVVKECSLWPPNHKMTSVGFYQVTDNCSEAPDILVGIISDEATATAPGAGGRKHAPDAAAYGDGTIFVRAER